MIPGEEPVLPPGEAPVMPPGQETGMPPGEAPQGEAANDILTNQDLQPWSVEVVWRGVWWCGEACGGVSRRVVVLFFLLVYLCSVVVWLCYWCGDVMWWFGYVYWCTCMVWLFNYVYWCVYWFGYVSTV